MQGSSMWLDQANRPVRLLVGITVLIALLGCSESVRKVSYVTNDSAALQAQSAKEGLSPLQSQKPQDLVKAGFVYLANKNLKIAELHFVTAINKDPKMVSAFIGMGRTEMLKGDYARAQKFFSRARELRPDSLPALLGEAQALRSQDKLDAAIKTINAAMVVSPEDIGVLKELAMIYDLMGKENLSAPLYLEIVNKAPDQASSHNNLGLNYMVRGKYPEAVASFSQAHELDRDNNRIKNNLASAYLLHGNEDKALNLFRKTVGEAEAYNNIGYLYMTQGRFDEAERTLNKALQLNPRFYVRAQENLDHLQELRRSAQTSRQ